MNEIFRLGILETQLSPRFSRKEQSALIRAEAGILHIRVLYQAKA